MTRFQNIWIQVIFISVGNFDEIDLSSIFFAPSVPAEGQSRKALRTQLNILFTIDLHKDEGIK